MAWDINRVTLVGRLTNDVDFRYTPSQTAIAKFGLAVGGRPNKDGTPSTSFFNVVVWGKAAESCNTYISKGKQVAIDGHLQQRSWQTQEGAKRSTVEIVAERVEFIGGRSDGQRGQAPASHQNNDWNTPASNTGSQSGTYSNRPQSNPGGISDAPIGDNDFSAEDDFGSSDGDVPF